MFYKLFLIVGLNVILNVAFAIQVSDFIPKYLTNENQADSGADTSLPVKPLVNIPRNNAQMSDNDWYCNNNSETSISNNIFCNNNSTINTDKTIVFESNSSSGNAAEKMVDNSVDTTGNMVATPSANQQTMQDQQVRNVIERTQNSFSIPIQPRDDVKLNINQQQIQFNIQY